MPCKDPTHTHEWPISGVHTFKINSCEKECDWCPKTQRGRLQKNASNLRHHAQTHINNTENTHLRGIKIARERAGRRKLITRGATSGPIELPSVYSVLGPPPTPPDVRRKDWDRTPTPVTPPFFATRYRPDSRVVAEASFPIEGSSASKDLQAKAAQAANGLFMLAGSQPRGDFVPVAGQILKKPSGSNAYGGTYSCTYHGCTLRFESPAKLQRHKREGHKQSATLIGSDRFSIRPELPSQDRSLGAYRPQIQQNSTRGILEYQLSLTSAELPEGTEHPVFREYSVSPPPRLYSALSSVHSSRTPSPTPAQTDKAAQETRSEQETRSRRDIQKQEQWNAAQEAKFVQETQLQKSSHPISVDSTGIPVDADGNYVLPAALLAQYPALATLSWSDISQTDAASLN